MKFLGLNINITRSPSSSTRNTQHGTRSLSPEAFAWLNSPVEDNTPILTNAYQQVVWVYRAVNVLAEQIANIPFLFSTGERGRENLITSGPLLDFYNHPHPHITRFQYWELRILWLMLRGECFRIPIYEDSLSSSSSFSSSSSPRRRLARVLILDPSRFHHIIEDHQLIGWRYTGVGSQAPLESQVFLPEEVWFEKLPNPFDFWRGLPPLYVADLAAKTDFAASSFMKGFLENNADTGLMIRTSEQLEPDQREQLLAALRDRKRRAGSADRPLLLWSAAEIVKPEISSADLQFLENRKFSRGEICAAFGVPEEIISGTEHAKYDVMQGARLNFIENRVAPMCARLEAEEEATVKSIDPRAVGWFDLESLPIMQDARRTRLSIAKTGFDMGVPFNELNRVLDLGFIALPHGNTCYLPTNVQPVATLPLPGGEGRPALRSASDEGKGEGEPSLIQPEVHGERGSSNLNHNPNRNLNPSGDSPPPATPRTDSIERMLQFLAKVRKAKEPTVAPATDALAAATQIRDTLRGAAGTTDTAPKP